MSIYFLSTRSEADNLALQGWLRRSAEFYNIFIFQLSFALKNMKQFRIFINLKTRHSKDCFSRCSLMIASSVMQLNLLISVSFATLLPQAASRLSKWPTHMAAASGCNCPGSRRRPAPDISLEYAIAGIRV